VTDAVRKRRNGRERRTSFRLSGDLEQKLVLTKRGFAGLNT
jgi:hypothetical protein